MLGAIAACNFWASDLQKVLRTCGNLCSLNYKCALRDSSVPFLRNETLKMTAPEVFFYILTSKCISRHSGVPFLQVATSKMAPKPSVF